MLTFFFFPLKLSTPLCLPLIISSASPPPLPLPTEWPKLWLDAAKNLVHLRKINPIVPGRFLQLAHIFPNSTLESAFTLYNGQHQYNIYAPSMGGGGTLSVTGQKFYFESEGRTVVSRLLLCIEYNRYGIRKGTVPVEYSQGAEVSHNGYSQLGNM